MSCGTAKRMHQQSRTIIVEHVRGCNAIHQEDVHLLDHETPPPILADITLVEVPICAKDGSVLKLAPARVPADQAEQCNPETNGNYAETENSQPNTRAVGVTFFFGVAVPPILQTRFGMSDV